MSAPLFEPFDVYQVPMDRPTLIEASAGTGKTWAISGLFVRLILEHGLAVENILVVTYTKAATAELSDRIRRKLAAMLKELKGFDSGDEFCKTYLEREAPDPQQAVRRLTRAMRCFDDAAIFTIHGFCQRVLTESAFESGMEFDTELLPDESEILRDIVDDYWRREIQPAHGIWVDYLVAQKQAPDLWLEEMRPHIGKQEFLALSPLPGATDLPELEAALNAAYTLAQALWRGQREDITNLLRGHTGLSGASYKKSSMEDWFGGFDLYFAEAAPRLAVPDKLVKLTPDELQKGAKKNCTPPEHPFFTACGVLLKAVERINNALEHKLTALKANLLRYCEQELPVRKRAKRVFSYHDLLNGLYQALNSPHGGHLAAVVRSRYPAALIDEFQDTDPIQYRIFQHLYRDQALPVFFVGDPKQAIYGFRGADVYTYLDAYRDTSAQKTQNTNQRSIPALVNAVNTLFAGTRPFLVENIDYRPVKPTSRALGQLKTEDRGQRTESGELGGEGVPQNQSSGIYFQLFPANFENGKEKSWSKEVANQFAAQATATEIARLLSLAGEGRAHLVKEGQARPLTGGDIAILVPGHRQGKLIQEELARRFVPSVRRGQDNVFESREALELEMVLRAIAEPVRGSLVNAALATEAMGRTAAQIAALASDEQAAEQVFDAFSRYHELWRDHGFMRSFRAWLIEREVAQRLLRHPDGERRLTNLLHLAELIQVESQARHGMDALLNWLSRAIHAPHEDMDAAMLRLESDAERVQIVTIHAAKGLEYSVVFCPFLWDGQLWRKNETAVTFHDADRNNQPTLDLGSPEFAAHKALAGAEKLAEKLRLLYVALTRAQHRCYITWGNVSGVETSALAWLLHGQDADPGNPLESMTALLKTAGSAVFEQVLNAYAKRAGASVETLGHQKTEDRGQKTEDAEQEVGHVLQNLSSVFCTLSSDVGWRMTSFSALSAGKHSEAPDYDALPTAAVEAPTLLDIYAFPRGAQPGTCLHAIFEEWEFTRNDPSALQTWVADCLQAHFIDEKWAPVVARTVAATLEAHLDTDCARFPSAQGVLFPAAGGIRLSDVGPAQRMVELGFSYPLARLDVARLRRLLAAPALGVAPEFIEAAQTLDFRQVNGYMMGFIDLVFEAHGRYYIVDYKSNWLGPDLASYAPPQLKQAMAATHYYLQYLIYSVALHRYLRLRLADYDYRRHFGGVYYLFLRGIDPAHQADTGIYRDRPSKRLIEALDRMMGGEGG